MATTGIPSEFYKVYLASSHLIYLVPRASILLIHSMAVTLTQWAEGMHSLVTNARARNFARVRTYFNMIGCVYTYDKLLCYIHTLYCCKYTNLMIKCMQQVIFLFFSPFFRLYLVDLSKMCIILGETSWKRVVKNYFTMKYRVIAENKRLFMLYK